MDAVTLGFADQIKQAGLQDDICLIIDECGNPKKGKHSAAVRNRCLQYFNNVKMNI
jgi:SRSO17 transposase